MELRKIILFFLGWRVMLQIILLFSLAIVPLQMNFLGGGIVNYLEKPYLWAWGNFDGEHYLQIAKDGYSALTYFFFPVYPILIREVSRIWGGADIIYLYSGLFISNLSFLLGVIGIVRLIRLDYSEKIAKKTLMLLFLFPTSFYFGAVYTEGLFFALVVWAFYFARKENWMLAGIIGVVASATRITGIALFPAFLVEYFFSTRKTLSFNSSLLDKSPREILKGMLPILLVPLGMFSYMFYLQVKTGDHLAFFHNLNTVFGNQRSSHLVVLPQVFYRYFFKLIPAISYNYFPSVFVTYIEIITGIIFLVLILAVFIKRRISEGIYALLVYLIPTLSGSFSSFPRYVLSIFPVFILSAVYINNLPAIYKYFIFTILLLTLIISEAMFVRGYWIS